MKGVFICQICKEPIHNFVCIDGLSRHITRWLPSGISGPFSKFNQRFLEIFHYPYDISNEHMICDTERTGNICLYCYLNEVYQWLMGQNKAVARRFRKIFSFGMDKSGFREIIISHAEPISGVENVKEESGICDECGEYTDGLRILNGRWICRECGGD